MLETINNWDVSVLDWMYENLRNPVCDAIFSTLTHLGDAGIFWIALSLVFIFTKKYRKIGIMMGAALLMGVIVGNGIVKNVVARIRPYDLYDKVHGTTDYIKILIGAQSDYSMPSGHTQASFAAATALLINNRKYGVPAIILAFIISFSRLYLYVHYPTDVIAGMIMGITWAVLSVLLVNYIYRCIEKRKTK